MTSDFDPKRILIQNYIEQIKLINGGVLPEEFMQKAAPEPAVQQSAAITQLSKESELLLGLYDEFANTDDGKALAAGLGKFARFAQSRVAKHG